MAWAINAGSRISGNAIFTKKKVCPASPTHCCPHHAPFRVIALRGGLAHRRRERREGVGEAVRERRVGGGKVMGVVVRTRR